MSNQNDYVLTPEQEHQLGIDDAVERLQNAGMEPMTTAPLDQEIILVLETNLVKVRAFWQDDIFSGGCWMDANGDGATDGVWRHWDNDELIGWLPVGEVKP